MKFEEVNRGEITLRVAVEGRGPVVLCVHGWPELWYSWRHQIAHLSQNGYTGAALDVRGYGGSSKPHDISAYTMKVLTSDVAAVARALSDEPVVLVGHDWGAPIAWTTALLHPDLVKGFASLSVPYVPGGDASFVDMLAPLYADRFFYQTYFQAEGVAEAELEADVKSALRKLYFSASGAAPLDSFLAHKPKDATLLDGMVDPDPLPAWLSDADLQVYTDAFEAGGFRGPINRYRAQRLDVAELVGLRGKNMPQPMCFIGGSKDPVRHFLPDNDWYAEPGAACNDFRGSTIVEGMGHWIQQEAPDETNAALMTFLRGL